MKFIKRASGLVIVLIIVLSALLLNSIRIDKSESGYKESLIENQELDLGQGIKLVNIAAVTGAFSEDGSDEPMENMLSATFINTSDKTLQYASVNINIDGTDYLFNFSTIPPQEKVQVYEVNRGKAPENVKDIDTVANNLAFFQEEPADFDSILSIEASDGVILIENISGEDINKEISVFYKNFDGEKYIGGITYRLRVKGLEAGEKQKITAVHANKFTRIMFVSYGN